MASLSSCSGRSDGSTVVQTPPSQKGPGLNKAPIPGAKPASPCEHAVLQPRPGQAADASLKLFARLSFRLAALLCAIDVQERGW